MLSKKSQNHLISAGLVSEVEAQEGISPEKGKEISTLLVNHIFESISTLRELNSHNSYTTSFTSTVLSSLTIGMSDILRKLVNELDAFHLESPEVCTAHGSMELIQFGSDRHSYLLDYVFKVKSLKQVTCRHCLRNTVAYDMKFYYCSKCNYVRCIFCNHSGINISWNTIQLLIEAFPNTIGKVFPGDRLIFHELAARDPTGKLVETCVNIYKSGAYVTDNQGELPLHWACMSGSNYHTINTLLTAYPDGAQLANQAGKLPLHLACQFTDLETIKILIAANPNACSVADSDGWIPLHYALRVQPDPSHDIVELLISTYAGSVQTPNSQGYFPLHLYLRNRVVPSLWVVKLLLQHFPFGAFVTAGQQDELPLHLVISRDPPPFEVISTLVEINPEGCLQASTSTSWSDSETPMSIAIRRAVKGGDVHIIEDYLKYNQPVEIYWNVVRIMLLVNKKYDPVLLGLSNWICRRWYIMGAYRKYQMKYSQSQSLLSAALITLEEESHSTDPLDKVFDFLAECVGSCRSGFRNIITFL